MTEVHFDKAHYQLRLRISTERFTFAVYDPEGEPSFHTADYPTDCRHSLTANLKTICKDNPFVGQDYRSARILLAGTPCVVVPQELFDSMRAADFYYACMPKENRQTVLSRTLPGGLVLLYAVDRTFGQLLLEYFPDACLESSVVPVMEHLLERGQGGAGRTLYAYFHERQMELYAFDAGKFLLHNAFRCTQGDDVLYYALYVWQQLGFDQLEDELCLIGRVPGASATLEGLQRYVARVNTVHPVAEFRRAGYAMSEGVDFDLQASFRAAETMREDQSSESNLKTEISHESYQRNL